MPIQQKTAPKTTTPVKVPPKTPAKPTNNPLFNMFRGMGNAKAASQGAYFEPGLYKVSLAALKADVSGLGEQYFVAECKILATNNPRVKIGETRTWYQGFKYKDSALSNIKALMLVLAQLASPDEEINPDTIDEEMMMLACGDEQPFTGYEFFVEAYNKPSKQSGKDFTRVRFRLLTEEDDELLAMPMDE